MAKDAELIFGASSESIHQIKTDLGTIIGEVERSGATKLRFTVDTGSTSAAAKSIQAQAKSVSSSISSSVGTYSKQLVQYYKDLDKQNTSFNRKNLNGIDYEIRQREMAAKKFSAQLQAQMQQEQTAVSVSEKLSKKQQQAAHSRENDLLQYRKVLAQVESQYNRYSDNIAKNPGLNADYQTVISKLKSGISSGKFDFKDVTDARTQVADLDNTLTETGGKVETFTQKLKNLFGIHLTTALTMVGVHALVQGLNQVYENVVKLDEAVVNLQVATGYSREQTQALIGDYSQYAKELGATTTQVAEAGNDWLNNIGQVKSL